METAPKKFLAFSAFNVISWQCVVGQVLVLFARSIDMPPSWVGFLLSFMPMSMLLVVLTLPLVIRFGSKRVMMVTWLVRNAIACSVFLIPWVVLTWGPRAGWYTLMAATLGFCLARAVGAGGWMPWLHEVVPEYQRGMFFSAETTVVHLLTLAVTFGQSLILLGNPTMDRFILIYGIGIAAGFISLLWMYRVPGGAGTSSVNIWRGSMESYKLALTDRPFLWFVLVASLCFSCASWYTASYVLFMRDLLGLSSRTIMALIAATSLGVLLTIRSWGRFADHAGSARATFKAMLGLATAALAFLSLRPDAPWLWVVLPVAVVAAGVFGAAFMMATNRAVLNYIKPSGRIGYTAVWTVGSRVALAFSPIMAGLIIQNWNLLGFQICFSVAGGVGIVCAFLCRWVVRDSEEPEKPSLSEMLNPAMPIRTFGRIVWITLGLDESNRPQNGQS
ncbi:MAG: MFS transporter [bacterium]|nr:MFS transporter [bacterium]